MPQCARLVAELEQPYAEGKFAEILAQVDACLPKDEQGNFIADQEKSDVVHLAFLAERMLEMNKQKPQEIKGFLGWLEGYAGAKVEALKAKLEGSMGKLGTLREWISKMDELTDGGRGCTD